MKIMIANDGPAAHYYIRVGWAKAFNASGHEALLWDIGSQPAFDVFDQFEPDIFMGQTYNLDKATFKCIKERPHLKVVLRASDWGDIQQEIDLDKYPILVASDEEKSLIERLKKETGKPDFVHNHYHDNWLKVTHNKWEDIGVKPVSLIHGADVIEHLNPIKNPLFESDVSFIGGYWPYKAVNLDRYIIPLCHPVGKYNVKIFGNSDWPVSQFLGRIDGQYAKDIFYSAKICPNVSEPHSQAFGYDIIERPFKVLASRGFCISDYVQSMAEDVFNNGEIVFAKTPDEFHQLIEHYVNNPDERLSYINKGYETVMSQHTYFHRAAKIFEELNMAQHSEGCLQALSSIINSVIFTDDLPMTTFS